MEGHNERARATGNDISNRLRDRDRVVGTKAARIVFAGMLTRCCGGNDREAHESRTAESGVTCLGTRFGHGVRLLGEEGRGATRARTRSKRLRPLTTSRVRLLQRGNALDCAMPRPTANPTTVGHATRSVRQLSCSKNGVALNAIATSPTIAHAAKTRPNCRVARASPAAYRQPSGTAARSSGFR